MQDTKLNSTSLDWSQWLCPGPRRVFSADEMARAGQQPWPKFIDTYTYSNAVVLLAINYTSFERQLAFGICVVVMVCVWFMLWVARQLWLQPTRRRLNIASWGAAALMIALGLVARFVFHVNRTQLEVPLLILVAIFVGAITAWWFLTLYRVQQIEGRLRELADQAATLKLARRLATAQIQPHFLFNTLASVQHWVDTQDPRAGSTLRSFTQYLRATLPMFERETLRLAEELTIVRSYLDIMQARLGARLCWDMQADPALNDLTLPPGALLTLVENAIAHGIEPALRGGQIRLRTAREGDRLLLEVSDDGAGLCDVPSDGVGLANTRARLQQQFGARASLQLTPLQPGCRARIEIILNPEDLPQ